MDPLTVLPFVQAIIVLSFVIFIVGMIRPTWVFFWMKEPSRYLVIAVSMILFMLSLIGYGETMTRIAAEKQKQSEQLPSAPIEKPK
jgi:hypothetical protein